MSMSSYGPVSTHSNSIISNNGIVPGRVVSSSPSIGQQHVPSGAAVAVGGGGVAATTTTAKINNNNKDNKDRIDPTDAAFWELDNVNVDGRIYTWLHKQLRIAIKEAVFLSIQQSKDNTMPSPLTSADIIHAEELAKTILPVLENNLIHSLVSLTVTNAPEELVNELVQSNDNDDGDDDDEEEEEDDDGDGDENTDDDDDDDDNNESDNDDDDDDDRRRQRRKRQKRSKDDNKTDNSKQQQNQKQKLKVKRKPKIRLVHDPYKIWFQIASDDAIRKGQFMFNGTPVELWNEDQDDIPESAGGKLSVLSVGGILNGMIAIPATFDQYNPTRIVTSAGLCQVTLPNSKALAKIVAANPYLSQAVSSLCRSNPSKSITVQQLYSIAARLHKSIEDQVKLDILQTTPYRIHQMLAPDLSQQEFANVRKRIYDTVILGKGMGHSSADDDELKEIPTASANAQGVHDIEKFKKCHNCGNNDQSLFVLDKRNGDITCSNCGLVVSESLMHEGSQFRKFEGEVDRNHHGDTANPLYSNAHNMSTSLSGVQPTTGAGIGGYGSGSSGGIGGRRSLETILKNAHAYTEMNLSQFGKNDRRTRVGYKDRQKKDAFIQITHAGEALNLHDAVIQRSKELFSGFRDDRELIQQFKAVLAACLCEAFEQFSAEGKNLLKQQQAKQEQQDQMLLSRINDSNNNNNSKKQASNDNIDGDPLAQNTVLLSSRAARRQNLHHANLAGKAGAILNNQQLQTTTGGVLASVSSAVAAAVPSSAAVVAAADDEDDKSNEKPAATWDLEDCRTWLLEASRRIAQAWVEERNAGETTLSKSLPSGPIEEVEGQLVEYSITLCEHLETEWRARIASTRTGPGIRNGSTSSSNTANIKRRVVTPRVTDMSKLGIKWQGAHERGSGGKGGVGNNARTNPGGSSAAGVAPSMTVAKAHGGVSSLSSASTSHPTSNKNNGPTAGQILLLKTSQKLSAILKDPIAGDAFHKELRTLIGRQEEKKRLALREEATRQRFHQMQRKPWLAARIQQE